MHIRTSCVAYFFPDVKLKAEAANMLFITMSAAKNKDVITFIVIIIVIIIDSAKCLLYYASHCGAAKQHVGLKANQKTWFQYITFNNKPSKTGTCQKLSFYLCWTQPDS